MRWIPLESPPGLSGSFLMIYKTQGKNLATPEVGTGGGFLTMTW
jgi:hypothetical protein